MVKISNLLFRDILKGINQIGHQESENRGPKNQGHMLCEARRIKYKKVRSTLFLKMDPSVFEISN